MGSMRLPGKVLMDLGGETVLARVVRRLGRAKGLDQIVVATTTARSDDAIVRECARLGTLCFRGSEEDVLDRYHQAARYAEASVVVRITSDCPLIEPALVDETIQVLFEQDADHASNVVPRTFPRGLDTEVFTMTALERAWREAQSHYQREHVTPYFYEHPELFRAASHRGPKDYSRHRWTLDTVEDLLLIRTIYARFNNRDDFHWWDAIALMEKEPQLTQLNAHVIQKAVQAS
jgi:spore coat polysaccharide biosynthesis protein SpsF